LPVERYVYEAGRCGGGRHARAESQRAGVLRRALRV
jgi:hypothetical protein